MNSHPIDKPDRRTLTWSVAIPLPNSSSERDGGDDNVGGGNQAAVRFKGSQGITLLSIKAEVGDYLPYHAVITDSGYVDEGILEAVVITAWTFIIDEQHAILILKKASHLTILVIHSPTTWLLLLERQNHEIFPYGTHLRKLGLTSLDISSIKLSFTVIVPLILFTRLVTFVRQILVNGVSDEERAHFYKELRQQWRKND